MAPAFAWEGTQLLLLTLTLPMMQSSQPVPASGLDAKTLLLGALAVFTVFYIFVLVRGLKAGKASSAEPSTPTPGGLATGFVTKRR